MTETRVQLNYLRVAPRKAKLVADLLRGASLNEAMAQLLNIPNRVAPSLLKLLKSAEANIKNNNHKDPSGFYIASIRVDGGPILKRMMPRARGRATAIEKRTSHITLILKESDKPQNNKFKINIEKPKLKKVVPKVESRKKDYAEKEEREKILPKKPGFFQKIFRRKSI